MTERLSALSPFVCLAFAGLVRAQPVSELTEKQRDALLEHAQHSALSPVDYLADKLSQHDLVLIGEVHQVRENCELVAAALEPLYRRAGLRCLATEFLRKRHTEAANAIVTAADYDEAGVIALFRDGPWPTWGFREYMDILRAAWSLNNSLADGAEPLEILGLDSEWSQHELWFGDLDRAQRFRILMQREKTMIEALAGGPLADRRPTLAHVGFAHSVTTQGERLGTVLRRRFEDRVFQVVLHHELGTAQSPSPLTALLERYGTSVDAGSAGFDVAGTPLATLSDPESMFWRMLPNAGLGDLAMGYVVLAPLSELRAVSWVPGFIDEAHFDQARDVAVRLGYVEEGECGNAAELDARLADRFPRRP